MKFPYAMSLSALALLCSAHLASAEDAAPPSKTEANAPHWYDSVTGTKFTSLEGSTAQLSLGEDGLALDVAAPDGSTAGKIFQYSTDSLGSVFDASDKSAPIGVFRQSPRGIEAEYADGHSETLSANSGGGLTIAITAPDAHLMCMKWYPQGHVFAESERKEALAAYASKLGLASEQKSAASVSSCADAPSTTASATPKAQKPVRLAAVRAPRSLTAPKSVLVRESAVHAIDAPIAPVPPEIAKGALVGAAPVTPPVAVPMNAGDAGAHLIQASAKEQIPANHGASSCLSVDSDGQNWGFRNACDNSVQFAYCLQNGKDAATACGSGTAVGGVARNGFFALIASSAVIDDNHQFRWVACSGDAGTVTPHLDRSNPPAGRCVRIQNS
ncbi:MAG TPA: hypothetical protein VLT91_10925 [Rhizomicrobium sp.]|nr:hypothetical protein [Rhizomicrobium sp.]